MLAQLHVSRCLSPDGLDRPDRPDLYVTMSVPRPLEAGERVELWLETSGGPADGEALAAVIHDEIRPVRPVRPADTGPFILHDDLPDLPDLPDNTPPTAGADDDTGDVDDGDIDDAGQTTGWDVRPARVVAMEGGRIAVLTGGWGLPAAPDVQAIVRRPGPEGIAEWEGEIAEPPTADLTGGAGQRFRRLAEQETQESIVIIALAPGATEGRLYQRRRSPRLALRLSPVRLTPLLPDGKGHHRPDAPDEEDSALPVARLTDVSTHGAGVVVDAPLAHGLTVALEFELPGESAPFTMRGRVIEPAVALHGEVQPQADGLPGFQRGIEFIGNRSSREGKRLAAALAGLLRRRSSRSQ
ncbi:MAG: PilZ domain-containing protein [Chloroflexota bacterium]